MLSILPLVLKICNLICSALTVALGTYAASNSLEGSVVAGMGAAVNHLRENPIGVVPTTSPSPLLGQNLKLFLLPLMLVLAFPMMGNALTLEWERNTEADMAGYQIYACWTPNCTVAKSTTYKVTGAIIKQPTDATVKPSWIIPPGKIGTIAVTAFDVSGNESPLSVPLVMDSSAPLPPKTLNIKELLPTS